MQMYGHIIYSFLHICFIKTIAESPKLHTVCDAGWVTANLDLAPQEEAEIVTGHSDPEAAAAHVLSRPRARTEWCVIKLGRDGAFLRSRIEERSYRLQGIKASSLVV